MTPEEYHAMKLKTLILSNFSVAQEGKDLSKAVQEIDGDLPGIRLFYKVDETNQVLEVQITAQDKEILIGEDTYDWEITFKKRVVLSEREAASCEFWKEKPHRPIHKCELCGVCFVTVKFGQNSVDFMANSDRHNIHDGKCWTSTH